ncbi:MAG: hypothetical protein PHS81_04205 [Candidatus Nanoarchaeia archaeon]|nr:hypothetical protein [Candidatus Nanoarchaeia archaeon]
MNRIPKNELESFDVHILPDVLSISLWVIEYLSDEKNDCFGSTEISKHIVDNLGISTSKQAVQAALTKAVKEKLCHKEASGFKLMKSGQDELLKQMRKGRVILLEPGKPFSAGIELGNIFSQMEGVVRISDPYVDEKTLDVIHKHFSDSGLTIRILTAQISDEARFKRELGKLQAEGISIEARKINKGILHDRYFIDDKHFWLSGNSLNSLGKKESFIVMLSDGIRQSILQTFNSRWQSAITI